VRWLHITENGNSAPQVHGWDREHFWRAVSRGKAAEGTMGGLDKGNFNSDNWDDGGEIHSLAVV